MFPQATFDFYHQGRSAQEDFAVARKIRIEDDLHALFQKLPAFQRMLLAQRIRKDVEDNGIGFSIIQEDERL